MDEVFLLLFLQKKKAFLFWQSIKLRQPMGDLEPGRLRPHEDRPAA